MKTIYGAISGLAAGFLTAIFLAPRSGKDTRKRLNKSAEQQLYQIRMGYHKLALKLGIGSRKKITKLTQERAKALNHKSNGSNVDPTVRSSNKSLEKKHETSAATKAINSSNAKESMKKVPAQQYKT